MDAAQENSIFHMSLMYAFYSQGLCPKADTAGRCMSTRPSVLPRPEGTSIIAIRGPEGKSAP
jgi:hypothetical protein